MIMTINENLRFIYNYHDCQNSRINTAGKNGLFYIPSGCRIDDQKILNVDRCALQTIFAILVTVGIVISNLQVISFKLKSASFISILRLCSRSFDCLHWRPALFENFEISLTLTWISTSIPAYRSEKFFFRSSVAFNILNFLQSGQKLLISLFL